MYKYLMYGVGFHSDFKIYNLGETQGEEEVKIISGKIEYGDMEEKDKDFFFSKDFVTFRTRKDAYAIIDGKTIIVEKGQDSSELEISAMLIGWCMAFLFLQRGYTSIHSTALNINNHGILVSGVSGAGKSTIASELIKRKHKYLVDDMAVINPLKEMSIIPAYPIQKICGNDIANISDDKLLYIDEERDKYSYNNMEDYCQEKADFEYLFCMDVADIEGVKIEKLTGLDSYMKVMSCMYLAEIYSFKGTPNEEKFRCLKMAEKLQVYKITRPQNGNTVKEIADLIENVVK